MNKGFILGATCALFATSSLASWDKDKPPVTMPVAINVVDEVLKLKAPKTSWESWLVKTSTMTAMRCLGKERLKDLSGRPGYEKLKGWDMSSNVFTFEKNIKGVCESIAKDGIYPVCERTGRFVSDSVAKNGLLSKVRFDSVNLTSMDDRLSSRQGIRCAIAKGVDKEQFYAGRTSFKWITKPLKQVENPTMSAEITFNDIIEGDGGRVSIPLKVIILTPD